MDRIRWKPAEVGLCRKRGMTPNMVLTNEKRFMIIFYAYASRVKRSWPAGVSVW